VGNSDGIPLTDRSCTQCKTIDGPIWVHRARDEHVWCLEACARPTTEVLPSYDRAARTVSDDARVVLHVDFRAYCAAVDGPAWIYRTTRHDVLSIDVPLSAVTIVAPTNDRAPLAVRRGAHG